MTDRRRSSSSPPRCHRSTPVTRGTALTSLVLALIGLTTQTGAQIQPPPTGPADGYPNFDIRIVRDGSRDYLERVGAAPRAGELAAARIAGVARLQSDGKTIDVIADGPLGSIEVVSARPGTGFLTAPAADRVAAMREFMATYPEVYGSLAGTARCARTGRRLHEPGRQHGVGGIRAAHQRPAGVSGIDPRGLHGLGRAGADDGPARARPGGRGLADHRRDLSRRGGVARSGERRLAGP